MKRKRNVKRKKYVKRKLKKDACYHKVKSRYDVWPSAYASGALTKCRKVGAKNWGNKSKNEELEMSEQDEKELKEIIGDSTIEEAPNIAAAKLNLISLCVVTLKSLKFMLKIYQALELETLKKLILAIQI